MEGCVENIPAHVYVSAMECAKIFLHRCVVNIPAYIREWFGGEVKLLYRINAHSYIYNANVHCAIFLRCL